MGKNDKYTIAKLTKKRDSLQSEADRLKAQQGVIGPGGSARGDDYAEALSKTGQAERQANTEVNKTPRSKEELQNSSYNVGYTPTVMSNANKIERVIPLLDSKASNLSFNLIVKSTICLCCPA